MAETLGAVASATQLAVMTMSLLDLVRKIKGGSKTLRRYQEQLLEVEALSKSISQNPLLQTPDVDFYTQSILLSISQTDLEHHLRRGWLTRTCTFIYKNQDIVDFFLLLDRQKSSLSLVIENIQSRALHQIQADIQAMSGTASFDEKPPTPPSSDDECSGRTTPLRKTGRMSSSPAACAPGTQKIHPRQSASAQANDQDRKPQPSPEQNVQSQQAMKNYMDFIATVPITMKGCHYMRNLAGPHVDLHVGPSIDSSVIRGKIIDNVPDTYQGNDKTGHGEMTVGTQVTFAADDVKGDCPLKISYNAIFADNNAHAVEVDDKTPRKFSRTKQFVGPSFVRQPASGQQDRQDERSSVVFPAEQEGFSGP